MADDLTREEQLERRVEELERRLGRSGTEGSGPEAAFWALMHRIFPADARRHMKSATREQLLAARYYLDRWIARLEETAESTEEEGSRRHERIQVE